MADDDRRALPVGRLSRLAKPGALAAKAAVGQAATWAANLGRSGDERDRAQLARMIRTAEDAVEVLGSMKEAAMKMGQLLSFADMSAVPPEFQVVLAKLQSDAPPMAWDAVETVIVDELGRHPDELFEWCSRVPMAAASIGQVHSARLHDGTEVVVKVQYPGVAAAIDADLRNSALLSNLAVLGQAVAGPLMPRSDIKAMLAEIRDRVLEELDYEREAANQSRFRDLYEGHPFVRIPEVVAELSSARVLTSAYHDGMRWSAALEQTQELKDTWGEVIYRFVFGSFYRDHLINADPHPGNYLFHDDGTVTFLDFGCVREFTAEQTTQVHVLARAAVDGDPDRLFRAVVDIGLLAADDDVDPRRLLDYLAPTVEPVAADQPFTYSSEWAREYIRRQMSLAPEYVLLANRFTVPPHWVFFGRLTVGVGSILAALGATSDWRSIIDELWEGSSPVTEVGRSIAAAGL